MNALGVLLAMFPGFLRETRRSYHNKGRVYVGDIRFPTARKWLVLANQEIDKASITSQTYDRLQAGQNSAKGYLFVKGQIQILKSFVFLKMYMYTYNKKGK